MTTYDSTQDTREHIDKVRARIHECTNNMIVRAERHDKSKLMEPEKSAYDNLMRFKSSHDMVYGSPDYAEGLKILGPGLKHHYEVNTHHPEHYPTPSSEDINALRECIGYCPDAPVKRWLSAYLAELESRVNGMSLLDVLEMLCDWKAAGERYKDGSIGQSLAHNRERFGLSDQLFAILENTVKELGW